MPRTSSFFGNGLFEEIERIHRDMDRLFGGWSGLSGIRSTGVPQYPQINIGMSPERIDVYVFAPGIDPKQLDISVQQDLLTIAGERRIERPGDVGLLRQERFAGAFRRVITLPEGADPDQVTARYREGVLQITIRRREATRPRRIEVAGATDGGHH